MYNVFLFYEMRSWFVELRPNYKRRTSSYLAKLVSNHPSWGRLFGTHDGHKRRVLAFVEPLPSQFPTRLYVLLHGALDLGHFKEESRYLDGLGIASGDEVSEAGAELLQAVAGHEAMRVYVKVREPGWEENSQNTLTQLGG